MPDFGLFITSILPPSELASNGWWKIFSKPSIATWSNYDAMFHNHGLITALKTTAYIAVGNTLLVVVIGALAGYALAWLEFPGRDWIFIGVIALLVVPLQMALIPMFRLYDTFGLFDTVFGIILFHAAFGLPFAIFLLRNFFVGLPKDILESARIDGASEIRIFLRLILPLGLPAIASLAIFQFLWTWNDLIVALTFGQNVQPITVWIFGQLREFGTSIDVIAPASFISLVIPLAVFFAFQRYFVQGLLAGSVKYVETAPRCAVVGSGLAALAAYATLRHGGLEPSEIAVFGTHADPTAVWRGRAAAIRQRRDALGVGRALSPRPRSRASRSASRCGPARCARSPRRSRTATTRPSTCSSRTRTRCASEAAGTGASRAGASSGSTPSTAGSSSTVTGPSRTCSSRRDIPGLARPSEHPGAVHAYEPHEYARRVAIVGAGMAAATEWLNALAAGSEVVSIRRRAPLRRPLNVTARAVLEARPGGVPRPAPTSARATAPRPLGAVLPAGPRVGRAARAGQAEGRSASRHESAQTAPSRSFVRPGSCEAGARHAAFRPGRGSRPRDVRAAGSCSPPTRPSPR